jgi:hypothetical protein
LRRSTEQVRTRRLADVIADAGLAHVDLMKMDIEGYEYEAILGSRELFARHAVQTLALEIHEPPMRARGRDPHAIGEFLQDAGYVLDRKDSQNLGTPYASMVFRAPPGARAGHAPR